MFNVHIQNKLEKKEGKERVGIACTCGYKGVQAVQPGSVAGGGCYGVMEFGMSSGIKQKK